MDTAAANTAHPAHAPLLPAWLTHFGALGVFGVAALDASPIPLPIPGTTDLLILILSAHHAWPWLQVLAGVAGSLLGGYVTWSAGRKGGKAMLERYVPKRYLSHITRWIEQHGVLSVSLAVLLPPPIPLTPFLLAAGTLGVTRKKVLWSIGGARTLRYGVEALLGAIYGRHILRWWRHSLSHWSDAILWTFIGLLIAGAIFGIWKYKHDQHRRLQKDTSHAPAQAA